MQSVLSQQGDFELEYIIVDGASTDGSIALIKQYAQQDTRIHWLSEPDHGQSDAINKGLRMATGEVVSFLNSDDVYLPDALQAVTETFRHSKVQWAYGRCSIINEHDEEITRWITWYKNILLQHYQYWLLLIVNYISQPATFWRRSLLHELGYLKADEHLVMDYELWCRFGHTYRATVIHQTLAYFRLYSSSKSGQRYVQQFAEEYTVARRYTHNPLVLILHKMHAGIVTLIYRWVR